MLLVKWFPCAILLLALIGSSFSLKCKSCEAKRDEKSQKVTGFVNCEVSRECRPGEDVCIKTVVKEKPSMFTKFCSSSKGSSKCFSPTVGECKTVKYSDTKCDERSRDVQSEEFKKLASDKNMEIEVCLCSGDDCNSAFGPAPSLGFVLGSAIIAISCVIGYGALGI